MFSDNTPFGGIRRVFFGRGPSYLVIFLFFGTAAVLAFIRRVFSAMAGFSFFGCSVAWPRRGELFLPYDACARSGGYIFIHILFWAWNAILARNRRVFFGEAHHILQFFFFWLR